MNVIVIGGGPAGMLAAITSAENGNKVTIIEKMQLLGKKLLITGKGRCNITSSLDISEFIKNTPGNGKFLYSSFEQYTNKDIIKFLEKQGLSVKEERGNRIFPVTDKSKDVLNCFTKKISDLKIHILLNEKVEQIITKIIDEKNYDKCIIAVKTTKQILPADKIILATGGKSYPLTGSTGDGYKIASNLGHNIVPIKPSLVPLEIYEQNIKKDLQGLSLRNVKIEILDNLKNKIIYQDFGEMLFTHFGVSGPIILSASAHLVRYKNIEKLLKNKNVKLKIDLKPALSPEKLNDRILRDFDSEKNKQFKNSLDKLLPQKLINTVVQMSGINPQKQVNTITKSERINLIKVLKCIEISLKNFRPIDEAIITSGGVSVKEIDPKTMESKIVKGLYFAGEIIDVDSYTGGFNLQIAYSTGYVAGSNLRNNKKKGLILLDIFTTIEHEICEQITEKKSKFIATILPAENKIEVEEKIMQIKKKYHDARHNCFAYRVLENQTVLEKSSDDGEPSGTAGLPILTILQKHNLCNVVVIVTRYFGGILLGTGGLVRAYSECTTNAIESAEKITKVIGFEMKATVQYNEYEKFKYYCYKNGINIENTIFNEFIVCYITLEQNIKDKLISDFETKNINLEDLQEFNKKYIKKCKTNWQFYK